MTKVNVVVGIDPAPGAKSFIQDFALDPGRVVRGRCVGPDGKPLADVAISCRVGLEDDLTPIDHELTTDKNGAFQISGFARDTSRLCIFEHKEEGKSKELGFAAAAYLKGDDPADVTVRLQPRARLRFHAVDVGENTTLQMGRTYGRDIQKIEQRNGNTLEHWGAHDGRFEVSVVAGIEFTLDLVLQSGDERRRGRVCAKLILKPGEVRGLGKVKLERVDE